MIILVPVLAVVRIKLMNMFAITVKWDYAELD